MNVARGAQLDAAYRDGVAAHKLGKASLAVPLRYTLDGSARSEWLRGWKAADNAKRAKRAAPCPIVPGMVGTL